MTELKVETATLEHVDTIWDIIQASFTGDFLEYVATGQDGYKTYLHELLARDQSNSKLLVVAKVEGKVAAFADITINSEDPNFLTRIAVSPKFRGRRLATRLMRKVQQTYATNTHWELDVMHLNSSARSLYRSLGFRVTSTRKWLGRFLSFTENSPGFRENWSVASDDNYDRYGFTNVSIQGQSISIAGTVARCQEMDTFLDDSFLHKVRKSFPKVDRAFIIVDAKNTNIELFPNIFEIARSDRMLGTF